MYHLLALLLTTFGFSLVAQAYEPFDGDLVEERATRRGDILAREDLQVQGIIDNIWKELKDAATCAACEGVLLLLKGAAKFGDDTFVDVVTELCKVSNAEDDDVCEGIIALEGPIIAQDLRKMKNGSRTSHLFCITFLGLCEHPSVDAYNVSFPSPKPPSAARPPPSGQTPLKVVHFSDIHVDPFYVPGSNKNCTKPICCRPYTASDAPGKNDAPAGPNGEHTCDAPISLEDSMYAAIKKLVPDAAFALFTGDIVDHAIWNTTQAQNTLDINDAHRRMAESGAFPYVYGTAGNHESSPTNAFPPTAVGDESQWVYGVLSSDWRQWIGAGAASQADRTGAYSVKHNGGKLRIISLNTNLYYVQNYWLYEEPMERDPSLQFAWLVSELDAAEQAGERVYIIAHMPMGLPDALRDGSNYFDQIVNRYEATIAAMFFGHTHRDHFQISYSDYDNRSYSNAVAISYIMPSLTPTSGHPTFRVYDVDPITFAVLDSVTYYADMEDPSFQTTTGGPVWTKYYSAREVYGPLVFTPQLLPASAAELSPAFWHNVTTVLENNQTAFDEYYARKSRGWDINNDDNNNNNNNTCTGADTACVMAEICQLRAARSQDNCDVPKPGFHFSRRQLEVRRDECGVSITRETIASLVVRRDMLELLAMRLMEKRLEVLIARG